MPPCKSMVGRCIPYGNSPFLGDMLFNHDPTIHPWIPAFASTSPFSASGMGLKNDGPKQSVLQESKKGKRTIVCLLWMMMMMMMMMDGDGDGGDDDDDGGGGDDDDYDDDDGDDDRWEMINDSTIIPEQIKNIPTICQFHVLSTPEWFYRFPKRNHRPEICRIHGLMQLQGFWGTSSIKMEIHSILLHPFAICLMVSYSAYQPPHAHWKQTNLQLKWGTWVFEPRNAESHYHCSLSTLVTFRNAASGQPWKKPSPSNLTLINSNSAKSKCCGNICKDSGAHFLSNISKPL